MVTYLLINEINEPKKTIRLDLLTRDNHYFGGCQTKSNQVKHRQTYEDLT